MGLAFVCIEMHWLMFIGLFCVYIWGWYIWVLVWLFCVSIHAQTSPINVIQFIAIASGISIEGDGVATMSRMLKNVGL